MTNPSLAAALRDLCSVCGHQRWRHRDVDGKQVCTEYVDCACQGVFQEPTDGSRLESAARSFVASMKMLSSQIEVTLKVVGEMMAVLQQLPPESEPHGHGPNCVRYGCPTAPVVTARPLDGDCGCKEA